MVASVIWKSKQNVVQCTGVIKMDIGIAIISITLVVSIIIGVIGVLADE